jgi:hypothetical protein
MLEPGVLLSRQQIVIASPALTGLPAGMLEALPSPHHGPGNAQRAASGSWGSWSKAPEKPEGRVAAPST